ncbi:MAG: hypothetical protein KAR30_06505 [Gammaproteobacteria bacterium]|nr:hypothetical protein [Gammaproteobacteria bacterium]
MRQHQEVFLDLDSNSSMADATGTDRKQQNMRVTHDRRVFSIKAIWYSITIGRRKSSQREINTSSEFVVDSHEGWLLSLTLGVIVLCISDAYMTILLMNHGAIETNPLMAILIENSVILFLWVKLALTTMSIMLLLILKNFTLFKCINGYHLIIMALLGYMYLLRYEFVLLDLVL